jgi:ABC-2 type transport system permease protein
MKATEAAAPLRAGEPGVASLGAGVRKVWAVFLRDLGAYFLSPIAYVVLFLFALVHGWLFWYFTGRFEGSPHQITLTVERLFRTLDLWTLTLSPILTMRAFAEEKRTGTLEMLLTAPVSEAQVVLGKFLAAQLFYTLIWMSLLPLFGILEVRGDPDWGPILALYTGLFFLGLLTNSLGILASAATRNQLIAAAVALTGNLLFLLLVLGRNIWPDDPDVARVFHFLSFTEHFKGEYSRGVIDLRYLFFYASFSVFFLFFSVRVLEARKWR